MTLSLEAVARTHIGLVRQRNEDAFYAGRSLFAVADGLGGHVAGDTASATAINALQRHDRPVDPADLASALGQAVLDANDAVRQAVAADSGLAGMGTTLVAMLWSHDAAVVANVGDSRAYHLRGQSQLVQITEDHNYGHLMADAVTVPGLPERLSRFLDGRSDGRSADLTVLGLIPGDRVLLCSDGLSNAVPFDRIFDTMRSLADPGATADRLLALAMEHGGPDNITVVLVDVHMQGDSTQASIRDYYAGDTADDAETQAALDEEEHAQAAVMRVRRRAIAQLIREQSARIQVGDFSGFVEVTEQEKTTGKLDA